MGKVDAATLNSIGRHTDVLGGDCEFSRSRSDRFSGTVEAADAATRQRQTVRQEHYKQRDADEKVLRVALRRSREQTVVHPLSPQAQVALEQLATAARTVTAERLHDWKWRGERFGHVGSLRARLRAERAPVLEAWAAIVTDPVIAAELVRREATLRYRWTEDFLRGSAAAAMRGSGSRAAQDPVQGLAAEARS